MNDSGKNEKNELRASRFIPAACGVAAIVLVAYLLITASMGGCSTDPAITPTTQTKTEQLAYRDDLTLALDGLRKLAQGADEQSAQRTVFYLNQWLASARPTAGEWKPDPLLDNLPLALKNTPGLGRLEQLEFVAFDLRYLQLNLWAHDIAERARRTQVPPEMAEWLKEVEKQAGVSEAEQLAAAERVFDWTIRNIQLDALPPPPKGPVATAGANTNPVTPAELGQPGPGYRHMPLELLVQGHGDAWERARVFILLCRQLNIDVVMLGLLEEGSPAPRGWLPAVLVKGELYLFDTSLGLPIPGPQGQGIATLAQVVADPKLLRQLDIEGEPPYPVAEADLKVVALIDAEPDALSRRMQLLQAALPAEQRLVLSTRLRILEPKLRQCQGIGQVSLWRVPLEAVLYTIGRSIVASQDPVVAKEVYLEVNSLNPNLPLAQGRNLHLQGQFENQDQAPGARSMYLRSRMPDQSINAIESSEIVRKAMGIDQQLPQDEQQKKAEIAIRTELVRTTKHHATYWLGLTYHEAGNNPAAIEWLATRTMEAFPPSPWIPGARYNLARCYEDFGNIDLALAAGAKKDKNTELARSLEAKAQSSFAAARKWLESDKDSPQRHGNLLRAKWIAERHPGDATKPIAPQENTTDASMP